MSERMRWDDSTLWFSRRLRRLFYQHRYWKVYSVYRKILRRSLSGKDSADIYRRLRWRSGRGCRGVPPENQVYLHTMQISGQWTKSGLSESLSHRGNCTLMVTFPIESWAKTRLAQNRWVQKRVAFTARLWYNPLNQTFGRYALVAGTEQLSADWDNFGKGRLAISPGSYLCS